MKRSVVSRVGAAIVAVTITMIGLSAQGQEDSAAPRKHRIMVMEYGKAGNRLVEVSPEGNMVWEHRVPSSSLFFQVLKNGNVVYGYGGSPTGAQEVTHDHKIVWNYEAKCAQVYGFDRLKNGDTILGEQAPCQAIEVSPKGDIVKTIPLTTNEPPYHHQVRNIHHLANGNLLVCHEGEGVVREVAPDGKIVWEYANVKPVIEALRLKNGNTLIADGGNKRVIEVTRAKKIVWEFGAKDAPDLHILWITGLQVLRNGNVVVSNWISGQEGVGVHAFEVTRDKKVVWTFADHDMISSATTVHVLGE